MSYTKEKLENISLSDLEVIRQQLERDSRIMTAYIDDMANTIPISSLLYEVEHSIRGRIKTAFGI